MLAPNLRPTGSQKEVPCLELVGFRTVKCLARQHSYVRQSRRVTDRHVTYQFTLVLPDAVCQDEAGFIVIRVGPSGVLRRHGRLSEVDCQRSLNRYGESGIGSRYFGNRCSRRTLEESLPVPNGLCDCGHRIFRAVEHTRTFASSPKARIHWIPAISERRTKQVVEVLKLRWGRRFRGLQMASSISCSSRLSTSFMVETTCCASTNRHTSFL